MLGVALGIGVLLALVGCTATEKCVAPQDLVNQLVRRLEASVDLQEAANPSVLLALNLAGGDSDGPVHKWLLREIKEEAVRRAQKDMTSGQVALHVLALLSACEDPQRVHALEQTLDLIHVLQQKTDEELAKLEADGVPKTTLYSMGLDTLALCLAGASGAQGPAVALAKQLLSPESRIFVDTRAMLALALSCVYNHVELQDVQELLREALRTVSNDFLDEQEKKNGLVGNIYSMGLVLQALDVTREFYAPREWNCAQAFSVVYAHDYRQPMAIAQVLPALVGRSYQDAGRMNCAPKAPIQVHYSVINTLQGKHFNYSTSVTVPDGSTLLRVMEVAAEKDPQNFSFETEQTSWGPFVTSIHGLAGSTDDRTYWHFLSAGNALEEGVGTYKPHNREHIQAVFSTY